ncbi:MAG: hypothetical protein ACXWC7_12055, partial [Chitinophagaceae bacterium]
MVEASSGYFVALIQNATTHFISIISWLVFTKNKIIMQAESRVNLSSLPETNGSILSSQDPAVMEECLLFKKIQEQFKEQFEKTFPDKLAPKTVIIIPSLTLDQETLSKVKGVVHYEERLLCLLMLLRMPRTHVIYLTSVAIDPVIIDY